MTQNEINDSRIIAEFMEWKLDSYQKPYNTTGKCISSEAEYGFISSWDWQIPAWSKVIQPLRNWAKKSQEHTDKYFYLLEEYEKAIVNNLPDYGFKILVTAIEFYNKNK